MKRTVSILLALALGLGLAMMAQTPIPVLGASMYEHYSFGDTDQVYICRGYWVAQTFTPSVAHRISSVKLKLLREGFSPGTVTVSIRATSGGKPTGSDLCSGTTNADTLPEYGFGEWREIALGSGCGVSAGTTYAIVVRAPGSDAVSCVWWRSRSSGTYGGGMCQFSLDYGSSWSSGASWDSMFEEWGDPIPIVGWETYPVSKVRVLLPWIGLAVILAGGIGWYVLRRRMVQS